MHPLLNIAISAARQAGDLLIRQLDQIDRIKITQKPSGAFCSDVDIKAEQAIMNVILKAYPEHGIIAEESGIFQENSETIWIIDSLNGTHNYLHGYPMFAISIAIQIKKRIEHGIIYDPLRHECFIATRGGGARLNDRRIRVSKQAQFSGAIIAHDGQSEANTLHHLKTDRAFIRQTGVPSLDLAYVACGRCDGFLASNVPIWAIAAGSLLVQEAGGFVTNHSGGDDYLSSGHILAATPKLLKPLMIKISS